jgi:hypothetical protein
MMTLRALLVCAVAWTLVASLSGCNTPIGVAPNLRGTYLEHALVTNPNGGGPQLVIWGPPDPTFAQPPND